MSYYRQHVFMCTNFRQNGERCCAAAGAEALRAYAKKKLRAMGEAGQGRCRINSAGCLDRCSEGPVMVIYPEGVWYTYHNEADIDEILQKHVLEGTVVDRLRLK
jgi:(2Fe-2S) ferredoxin